MGADGNDCLAAILDALTLMQGQVEELSEQARQIRDSQETIISRLDSMSPRERVGDTPSQLESIIGELCDSSKRTGEGLARVAEVAGWAHAAAVGNTAPLPVDVLADPLLERYVLGQPADRTSTIRALADWNEAVRDVQSRSLIEILRDQYRPSPTDSREDRVLRYKLAAISRDELAARGVDPPPSPTSTFAEDRSEAAQRARSAALRRLWVEGEGAALLAEPELAGALDIVAAARRESTNMPEAEMSIGIAELHRAIANCLEMGERPILKRGDHIGSPKRYNDRVR
ncbi:hypothetical protein SAMN05216557_10762 [Sphingomonas carotinifaciens]|nr:hypothetical protein SAMN05216557_10762 [Sphingomonas carotinifaciens]